MRLWNGLCSSRPKMSYVNVLDYCERSTSGKDIFMRVQAAERPVPFIEFAPKKAQADATVAVDDAGQHIVALLQRASETAKAECQVAMDLAHRASSELREAEERASKFEAE